MRLSRVSAVIFISLCMIMQCVIPFAVSEPSESYAQATDKAKVITVYTEPDITSVGSAPVTENGIGLDTLVTPATASGYEITWKSSDTDVATVDENGHVHGTLTGKYSDSEKAACVITATVSLDGMTSQDSVTVTVRRGRDLSSISLRRSKVSVYTGSTYDLDPEYSVTKGYDVREEMYFISSDPSIAFVDDSGVVTGISEGTATITAYTLDGRSASCVVTVKDADSAQGAVELIPVDELIILYSSDVSNKKIKSTLSEHDAEYIGITRPTPDDKAVLASCSADTDIEGLMNEVSENSDIRYVQPNFRYTLDSDDPYYRDVQSAGTSYLYTLPNQYFHFQSGFDSAWKLLDENGISQTTIVGVLDSGVEATHKDLTSNLILDENGEYTRFDHGVKKTDTQDTVSASHGTHVSGIIGSVYGNGTGGAGAASGVSNNYSKILPVGVVSFQSNTEVITTYDVIQGLRYAASNGARVINMSLGGSYRDRLLGTAVQECVYNDGIVVVGSAGNNNTDLSTSTFDMSYPADLKEVIGVTNINRSGKKHTSSNYGYAKDIAAPGTSIFSTIKNNKMGTLTGTSMATPVVSSACALMLDADPDLTPSEVRNILCATAKDPDGYFVKNEMGYGELDAYAAVKTAYAIKAGTKPDSISIKIKTPYRDREATEQVESQSDVSFSAIKSIKAVSKKKKQLAYSFRRPSSTVTTTKTTVSIDPYTYEETIKDTETSSKEIATGIKYRLAVKLKGSKWKYYNIPASGKNTGSYKAVKSSSGMKITLKKLKSRKTYYVKVRPFRTIDGDNHYGSWTKEKKVKVK